MIKGSPWTLPHTILIPAYIEMEYHNGIVASSTSGAYTLQARVTAMLTRVNISPYSYNHLQISYRL